MGGKQLYQVVVLLYLANFAFAYLAEHQYLASGLFFYSDLWLRKEE